MSAFFGVAIARAERAPAQEQSRRAEAAHAWIWAKGREHGLGLGRVRHCQLRLSHRGCLPTNSQRASRSPASGDLAGAAGFSAGVVTEHETAWPSQRYAAVGLFRSLSRSGAGEPRAPSVVPRQRNALIEAGGSGARVPAGVDTGGIVRFGEAHRRGPDGSARACEGWQIRL